MDIKGKTATSETDTTAANATATATLAAPGAGLQYYITGFDASFDGAAVATPVLCTVTIGSRVIKFGVSTSCWLEKELLYPIPSGSNGAASIVLAAGGAGANGNVAIRGFIGPSTLND